MGDNQEQQAPVTEGDLERIFTESVREGGDGEVNSEVPPIDPAAEQSTENQEPVVDPILAAAAEAGLSIEDYGSPQELFSAIAEQKKQLEESAPYVDYAKRVLPYDDAVQKAIAPPQEEPPVQGEQDEEFDPSKHFAEQWKAPEYKKEWEPFLTSGMITLDDKTGQYIPADGYANSVPLPIIQGLNEHRNFQRGALERLLENPYQSTWEAIQTPIEKLVSAEVEKRLAATTQTDDIGDWEKDNDGLLYDKTDTDIYGNRKMTEYGEQLLKACNEIQATAGGNLDQMAAIRIAERMVPKPQPATGQDEQDSTSQEDPAGKKQSFLDDALAKAGHSPNSGGYAESTTTAPVVQTNRELENLFLVEARKAGLK